MRSARSSSVSTSLAAEQGVEVPGDVEGLEVAVIGCGEGHAATVTPVAGAAPGVRRPGRFSRDAVGGERHVDQVDIGGQRDLGRLAGLDRRQLQRRRTGRAHEPAAARRDLRLGRREVAGTRPTPGRRGGGSRPGRPRGRSRSAACVAPGEEGGVDAALEQRQAGREVDPADVRTTDRAREVADGERGSTLRHTSPSRPRRRRRRPPRLGRPRCGDRPARVRARRLRPRSARLRPPAASGRVRGRRDLPGPVPRSRLKRVVGRSSSRMAVRPSGPSTTPGIGSGRRNGSR